MYLHIHVNKRALTTLAVGPHTEKVDVRAGLVKHALNPPFASPRSTLQEIEITLLTLHTQRVYIW